MNIFIAFLQRISSIVTLFSVSLSFSWALEKENAKSRNILLAIVFAEHCINRRSPWNSWFLINEFSLFKHQNLWKGAFLFVAGCPNESILLKIVPFLKTYLTPNRGYLVTLIKLLLFLLCVRLPPCTIFECNFLNNRPDT